MKSLDMDQISRRDFARLLSLAAGAAVLPVGRAWAQPAVMRGPGAEPDPMKLVDPELRPAAELIQRMAPKPAGPMTIADLIAGRSSPWNKPPIPPEAGVVERRVPGRGGAPDVRVLVVNAKPGARRPGILHIHGGGYVTGTADQGAVGTLVQARALDCTVVSVDYRVAPETPFPGSLEDNYAALKWMHAHADEIGVDPARIAVQGESAGGGHAAMLAIAARDRGEVPLVFQALVYPMLDDRTGSGRQPPGHVGTILWTREANRLGWTALLGRPAGSRAVPSGAVPVRVDNLAGLPPAWIGCGALDLFVDEDMEYARRLNAAGVSTELYVPAGAYHGFEGLVPGATVSKQFVLSHYNALARAFGIPPLAAAPDRPDPLAAFKQR